MTAQRLFSAMPPQVRLVLMVHGPNTSTPTFVNGGPGSSRSAGRFDIFCSSILPLSLLQVTHFCTMFDTSLLPPINHKPAERTAPSVRCLP